MRNEEEGGRSQSQEGGECEEVSGVGLEAGLLRASGTVWNILQCTPKERNMGCLCAECQLRY